MEGSLAKSELSSDSILRLIRIRLPKSICKKLTLAIVFLLGVFSWVSPRSGPPMALGYEESTHETKPPITALVFAHDGKLLVGCSQKGLHIFSWPTLELKKTVKVSFANLHCVVFSPNGKYLAVGGGNPAEEGVVEIFTWPDCKSQAKLSRHRDSVMSVVWEDNQTLVTASLDRSIRRWDIKKQRTKNIFLGHSRGVTSLCILKDGTLVSAGHDQSVRVWDRESEQLIRSLNQHTKPINAMALSPLVEGRPMIATAASDRTIRFWQPTIGRMVRYIRLESEPLDIAWINESRLVATCVDGNARVIDTENVKVLETIPAIKGWAYTVAIHPKDQSIAIGGTDAQLLRTEIKKATN